MKPYEIVALLFAVVLFVEALSWLGNRKKRASERKIIEAAKVWWPTFSDHKAREYWPVDYTLMEALAEAFPAKAYHAESIFRKDSK